LLILIIEVKDKLVTAVNTINRNRSSGDEVEIEIDVLV
jgi:hypothetical protein